MNQRYALLLKLIILFELIIYLPAESLAGPNNIYGVKKGSSSKSITGMRSGNINSGKLYGNHGYSIKKNYFGKSFDSSSKTKSKKKDSPPVTWNDVYKGKKSNKNISPQDDMEGF